MATYRDPIFNDDWQNNFNVLGCNQYMLDNQIDNDVTFLLPGPGDTSTTIRAHKYVLVSRSPVFFAMLNGPLAEKNRHIKITDITPEGFWNLLRHMYHEHPTLTFDNVFHVLYAAKKYIVTKLVNQCVTFLENIVKPENACLILDQSLLLDDNLEQRCLQIIQRNTKRVLLSETFFKVSHFTLCKILQCDRLSLNEIDVFNACNKWAELQCTSQDIDPTPENKREILGAALTYVHIPSLSKDEFTHIVVPTKLLSMHEENAIFRYLMGDDDVVESVPFAKGKRQFFAFRCTLNYDGYVRHTTAISPLYDGFIRRCRWSMNFQCDHTISLYGITLFGDFQGTVSVFQNGNKKLEYSSEVSERSIKFENDLFLEAGQFTIVTDATSSYSGHYFYKAVRAGNPRTECDHEDVMIVVKDCTSLSFISHLYYTHSEDLVFFDGHFAEQE